MLWSVGLPDKLMDLHPIDGYDGEHIIMINDQILIHEPSSVFLGESHVNSTWIHLLQGKSRQLLYSTEFLSPGLTPSNSMGSPSSWDFGAGQTVGDFEWGDLSWSSQLHWNHASPSCTEAASKHGQVTGWIQKSKQYKWVDPWVDMEGVEAEELPETEGAKEPQPEVA